MVPTVKRRGSKGQSNEPVIDTEFQSRIPPLTPEEENLLRESLLSEGCRETIKTWGGKIIDGHHRFKWCNDLNIAYKTEEVKGLADREAVLDWIDRNQLGRRNLHHDTASLLRGRVLNREKQKVGRPKDAEEKMSQSETIKKPTKSRTSKKLADKFGVSRATVDRDGAYAAAVDTLKPLVPELEAQVIRGEGPPRKQVVEAAKVAQESPEKAREILTKKPEHKPRSKPKPPVPETKPVDTPPVEQSPMLALPAAPFDPAPYYEAAKALLGEFDSEPTSLDGPWDGRVWLNIPPETGRETIEYLCVKLYDGQVFGTTSEAVILADTKDTGSDWFQTFVKRADAVCLVQRHSKAVMYIGRNDDAFIRAFLRFGIVVLSVKPVGR
jgi:hypothetical protein